MPFGTFPLKLGTRGSPLALTQAHMVRDALIGMHGWESTAVEIVTITTSGDRIQDRALADIGGKALWTKELDLALADGRIDCAVHSMKDVETIRPDAITIAAMLERADVRDRLIGAESIAAIPQNGRIGTSSPRRAAQIRRLRPDLQSVLFRGNVDTRLARLARGEADATLLAAAGLARLNRPDVGTPIPVETLLPAPSQGAVGIECLAARHDVQNALAAINHQPTYRCVMIERSLLAALGAGCHSPVAALAVEEGGALFFRAALYSADGAECIARTITLTDNAADHVATLAKEMLAEASPALRALFA